MANGTLVHERANGWRTTVIGILSAIIITLIGSGLLWGRHPITSREVSQLQRTISTLQATNGQLAVQVGELAAEVRNLRAELEHQRDATP